MNAPNPIMRDLADDHALNRSLAYPRWPLYPAARERLKLNPIGRAPHASLAPEKPTPMIDLEQHSGYLESM